MKLGVQTYTIRKYQKKDIRKSYLPLIEMGIKDFEISRIDFSENNSLIIKQLIDQYDIRVVSLQVKPKQVFHDVERLVKFCCLTGCKIIVISMLPFDVILGSDDKFYHFVSQLDKYYDIYHQYGIELAFHHHNWEFVTLSNGKTRMDEIIGKTEKIKFVLDTFWSAKCGIDPCVMLNRFHHRLIGIHLRDLRHYKKGIGVKTKDEAIGEGILDIPSIVLLANKHQTYMVFEQKTREPYKKLKMSYDNTMKILEGLKE